ncbi:hypothetical protein [Actinokineospora sp.]|uniref:hypothetical protein n=1 Tax=Actinokineospora sp. TaxID=1872133 RepID=UPI003D6B8C2F
MKKRHERPKPRLTVGPAAVNQLLAEVYAELRVSPPAAPTSALLDGSALERRLRREERRAIRAVVRALPSRRVVVAVESEAA